MRTALLCCALLSVPSTALPAPQLNLRHCQDWSIIVPTNTAPGVAYAAEELRRLLHEATTLDLSIAEAPHSASGNIFVGHSPAMERSSAGFTVSDLGDEGVRIRITPDNLAIAGAQPRGTLYAVYEFAERYLGVRFLTHDHTHFPNPPHRRIPCETWSYTPPFTFRWSYYQENADRPEFAARLRINTVTHAQKLGGVTPQDLISHTLHHLLPVEEYGREHPEYFALVDGQRKLDVGGGGPEPCVTHPDVIEIVARNVIKALDEHPGRRNFSVSQNDNDAYCRCERCETINQSEGTPMGAHLAFVNAVAERVETKHPNVKIGTLAYWYTRKAPRTIRPRHNVQIQLCSIECSTLYPLDDPNCAKNRAFCEDMDAWSRICQDIWIWNYNTNFRYYDLPFPNLRVISPNLQYFLRNHVHGVFMQANGNGKTGELSDLRNYVLARCLWNPQLDSWQIAQEFCRLHYGQAARTMIQYLTFLHNHAEESGFEPTCFPMPFELGLNPQSADRIFSLFQKAIRQTESETVRNRVEKASIAAYRTLLEVAGTLNVDNGRARVTWADRYGDVVGSYRSLTRKHGQTRAEEWEPIDHYYNLLNRATIDGYRAEILENDIWRLMLVAEGEAKVVELLHKPTQQHLLMPPGYRSLRHLFDHLTLVETATQGLPNDTPLTRNLEKSPDLLRLTTTTADGSTIERTIGFPQNQPEIIRFETRVTWKGATPHPFQFRVRPEFFTGQVTTSADQVGAYILDDTWRLFNDRWHDNPAPGRTLLQTATSGGLAYYNHQDRFGAHLAYDPTMIEQPDFYWDSTYPLLRLELLTRPLEIQPDGSTSFHYDLKFLKRPPL